MCEIKLADNEITYVINALDFYSRIWIGQYDQILFDLRWYRDCDDLDKVEEQMKSIL